MNGTDLYDGNGFSNGVSGCTADETQPKAGEFVDPVGFAVDTDDPQSGGQAEYVLDRTSDLPFDVASNPSNHDGAADPNVTTWRLQKLEVVGGKLTEVAQDQFSLPADTDTIENDQSGISDLEMFGLTVDPTNGRVYALMTANDVDAVDSDGEVGFEIVAWSTTPNNSGQLVGVSGLSADGITAGINGYGAPSELAGVYQAGTYPGNSEVNGSLMTPDTSTADQNLYTSGNPYIEDPEGIAVTQGSSGPEVVVQGMDATAESDGSNGGLIAVSASSGAVVANWSSNMFWPNPNGGGTQIANDVNSEDQPGSGISTDPQNGTLTYLDDEQTGDGTPDDFDVASIPANIANTPQSTVTAGANAAFTPLMLSTTANAVTDDTGVDDAVNDAPVGLVDDAPEQFDAGGTAATEVAGPQIIALSNGLYAGVFDIDGAGHPDLPGIWTPQDPGIRLLDPADDPTGNALLSESTGPLDELFDTLGNTTANTTGTTAAASACSLEDALGKATGASAWPALAAGSSGALWVLTTGQDSTGKELYDQTGTGDGAYQAGRELIELAPGAGDPCQGPSGTFTLADTGPAITAGSQTLTVTAGDTVSFDASPINNNGAAVAAYDWTFGDGNTTEDVADNTDGISAQITHRYTKVGTWTVVLDVLGDYGTYQETATVKVNQAPNPTAAFSFSPSSPTAGQSVSFDASASAPAVSGDSLTQYQWTFGDGGTDVTTSPTDTHTFSSAGTDTVSLVVVESNGQHNSVAHTVTVAAASSGSGSGTGSSGSGSSGSGSSSSSSGSGSASTGTGSPQATTTTATKTATTPSNVFSLGSLSSKAGKLSATGTFPGAGQLTVLATFTEKVTVKKGKKKTTEVKTVTFASTSRSVSAGTVALALSPSGPALSALKAMSAHSSLTVTVKATFTPSGGSAASKSSVVHVAGLKAKKK